MFEAVLLSEDYASILGVHAHVRACLGDAALFPAPTPLLSLCKRARRLYRRVMEHGVLSMHKRLSDTTAVSYVLVPHDPDPFMTIEDDAGRRSIPAPVQLPYAWRLVLHTTGLDPMVVSQVHPCHLLWRRTLLDLPGSRMKRLAEEARVALFFIHDGSTDVHDLNELLNMWELAPSARAFYAALVQPLATAMRRMAEAREEYVAWSRRCGARRLGLTLGGKNV